MNVNKREIKKCPQCHKSSHVVTWHAGVDDEAYAVECVRCGKNWFLEEEYQLLTREGRG